MAVVTGVTYGDPANKTVSAIIDGVQWFAITLGSDIQQAKDVQVWIDAGNIPAPYVDPAVHFDLTQDTSFMLMFDHENRIRTVEGVPPLTFDEFKLHMKRT